MALDVIDSAFEAIFHSTVADDEYEGFTIPANSVIVANTW